MIRPVRRRYLALKVDCDGRVDREAVLDAVGSAVMRLFGEVGVSQAGLYLVRFDEASRLAVFRCSHRMLPSVKAAIASVTKVGGQPAAIHVLRVSGTLKALGRKTVERRAVARA